MIKLNNSACLHGSDERQISKPALVVLFFVMLVPWLNPFAPGPSPSLVPLLLSWACAGVLLGVYGRMADGLTTACLARCVAWAWLVAGLLSAGMGLCQYFGAESSLMPWINATRPGEAFANLRQRNQFASLTNIALAALIWLASESSLSSAQNMQAAKRRMTPILLATSLLVTGTAASSSRTGLVQLFLLVAFCGIWGVWRLSSVRHLLMAALLAYCVATVALPLLNGFDLSLHGLAARLLAGDEACVSRLTLWSNVLHLIAQKPLSGWGWGELDYAHYITLYDGPRFCGILDNAHNLPLQLAAELGIPVAVVVCGGFVWWVLRQRPWRETDPTRQLAWSVMAVILLHSMLEYPLWYGPFQIAFCLCVGLLCRTTGSVKNAASGVKIIKNSLLETVSKALLAMVFIVTIGYAAWDYHRVSQIYLAPQERDAAYRDDTLAKIQDSWLFADQVQFAQLLLKPLTRENAQWTFNTATELLHYSPEPRIIEKTIESAVMLRRNGEALEHLARYQAAFPEDYARWTQANAKALSGLQLSEVRPGRMSGGLWAYKTA